MSQILFYLSAGVIFIHGLIHLMGFVTYWQLATINELPYKTALLKGAWEVGEPGIRLFGLLWLAATVAFLVSGVGRVSGQDWWRPLLIATVVFSLVVTALDYDVAYAGVVINVVMLVVLVVYPLLPL